MKTIAILTATRAEFGLLEPIIKKLKAQSDLETQVLVTGAHLSPDFGLTYNAIEAAGIEIDRKVEMQLSSDSPGAVTKSMALAMLGFSEYFQEHKPDALLVLGDRYETLAVCIAAMNERIPIFHLYGGETTEGALDEAIRHSITKMSLLHFTSTEAYRKRIIQLGEAPERVFTVGAMGVENALAGRLLSKEGLEQKLHFAFKRPFAVATFHPVTLEAGSGQKQMRELLAAFDSFPDLDILLTKANADAEGRCINQIAEEYAAGKDNVLIVDSLGSLLYLSAVKHACAVVGNSSSGLVEAPSLGTPTVNIGDRQKGRLQAESVINCPPNQDEIVKALNLALSKEFQTKAEKVQNPYGSGNTSDKINALIKEKLLFEPKLELKKKFYDIEYEV